MKTTILLLLFIPTALHSQTNIEQHKMGHKKVVQNTLDCKFEIKQFENITALSTQLKSTNNTNYKLDSTYNYLFNSITDSILSLRTFYTYSSKGLKTMELSFKWNDTLFNWNTNYEYDFTYDSAGNKTSEIQWDTANIYHTNYKYEYTYDSFGNLISMITLAHYGAPGYQWYPEFKDVYDYDTNDNKISDYLYFTGDNYRWFLYKKFNFSYDFFRNMTLETDTVLDQLINKYHWNGSYKYEHAYNSFGKDTLLSYYYWDQSDKQWIEVYKAEYIFGANGRQTSFTNYFRDDSTDQLKKTSKAEYGYGPNGDKTLESRYSWNIAQDQWILIGKEYNYYSIVQQVAIKSTTQLQEMSFNLFPNPALEKVSFEIYDTSVKQAFVYNMNGQLVKSFSLQQGLNTLNISMLPKGVYTFQIPEQKCIKTQKFVKK